MFIKIAPKVRVYLPKEQLQFIDKYRKYDFFRSSQLEVHEINIAKSLADKSIFVRKKLDIGMQYALNRRIRFVKDDKKK